MIIKALCYEAGCQFKFKFTLNDIDMIAQLIITKWLNGVTVENLGFFIGISVSILY